MGLYGTIVPRTVKFLVCISRGRLRLQRLALSPNHPRFMLQNGDSCGQWDWQQIRLPWRKFRDEWNAESLKLKHEGPGILSWLMRAGRNLGSLSARFPHRIDRKHVIFGRVVEGMDVVKAIERCGTSPHGTPKKSVAITDCGVVALDNKQAVASTTVKSTTVKAITHDHGLLARQLEHFDADAVVQQKPWYQFW